MSSTTTNVTTTLPISPPAGPTPSRTSTSAKWSVTINASSWWTTAIAPVLRQIPNLAGWLPDLAGAVEALGGADDVFPDFYGWVADGHDDYLETLRQRNDPAYRAYLRVMQARQERAKKLAKDKEEPNNEEDGKQHSNPPIPSPSSSTGPYPSPPSTEEDKDKDKDWEERRRRTKAALSLYTPPGSPKWSSPGSSSDSASGSSSGSSSSRPRLAIILLNPSTVHSSTAQSPSCRFSSRLVGDSSEEGSEPDPSDDGDLNEEEIQADMAARRRRSRAPSPSSSRFPTPSPAPAIETIQTNQNFWWI